MSALRSIMTGFMSKKCLLFLPLANVKSSSSEKRYANRVFCQLVFLEPVPLMLGSFYLCWPRRNVMKIAVVEVNFEQDDGECSWTVSSEWVVLLRGEGMSKNIRAEEIDVKRLEIERSDYYESLDKEIEEAYTIAAEAKEGPGLF